MGTPKTKSAGKTHGERFRRSYARFRSEDQGQTETQVVRRRRSPRSGWNEDTSFAVAPDDSIGAERPAAAHEGSEPMRLPVPLGGRDFDVFEGFRRDFDDLLSDFGRRLPTPWRPAAGAAGLAAIDIGESKDAFEISVELPGVDESDVKVSVEGQSVVISGEKKTETEKKDKEWQVVERSYGAFRRVVPLTFRPQADKISATFDKGILHVTVPKPDEMVAKKIDIPIGKPH
jgi:HSP20 family protein